MKLASARTEERMDEGWGVITIESPGKKKKLFLEDVKSTVNCEKNVRVHYLKEKKTFTL